MLTFDLHYHANINHKASTRTRRLKAHHKYLRRTSVNYVASTEHVFKEPLEAYLRLADISSDLVTEIIPGVESVSIEGIDIIFIYRNEQDLKNALSHLGPYSWSIKDMTSITQYTGAISLVPHPFYLGNTCAGNVLSCADYNELLEKVDYVEIHNGSALLLMALLDKNPGAPPFPKVYERASTSIDLPPDLRGQAPGWAVGSDAHFPGDQYVVGITPEKIEPNQTFFDLLSQKLRLEISWVKPPPGPIGNARRVIRNGGCACVEGLVKRVEQFKNMNWSAELRL